VASWETGTRLVAPIRSLLSRAAGWKSVMRLTPVCDGKRSVVRPIVKIGFWRGFRWSFSLLCASKAAYNMRMEISFAPELEAKLNWIASQTGKGPDEVVRELVASYLDHDEWFRQEVGKGLASLDQGKTVSHEDVRRQMDRILGS
jgi:predicted transcriptional regulator